MAERGIGSPLLMLAGVLLLVALKSCSGDLEPVLQRCCQSGERLALNHTSCSLQPSALDPEMSQVQNRRACVTSVYICCVREQRRRACSLGKEAAKQGNSCESADATFSDCCAGCSLGIQAGQSRSPCTFHQFSFGATWDEAYIGCCEEMSTGQGRSPFTAGPVCEPNKPCNQLCEIVNNQIKCSCYPGFHLLADQATCDDVNECRLGNHSCNPVSEYCVNTYGGFECAAKLILDPVPNACPRGYVVNPQTGTCDDIDECLAGNPCPAEKACVNIEGSFDCRCLPGFVLSQSTGHCIDVDECFQRTDRCNRSVQICQNVHGTYHCIPRTFGSSDCPAGFRWNGSECLDVDECSEPNSNTCNPASQNCVNNVGGYACVSKVACPPGLRWVGNKCEDINECVENRHDCDRRYQVCVNTVGSFQCQNINQPRPSTGCDPGFAFEASSNSCRDIDECASRPCAENQECLNLAGSYRCRCAVGYDLDPVSRTCKDINECQVGRHPCVESQRCDNTPGSFRCVRYTSCGTGYTLNAATNQCEDNDECALNRHNCGPDFQCRNMVGSFRCHRIACPAGQRLLPDGTCKIVNCGQGFQVDDAGNCIDVDECALQNVCRRNQQCINTAGSYRCQDLLICSPGFELNELGTQCDDVDECQRQLANCGSEQTCRNRPGGYVCECPQGYFLNHQLRCEDIDECSRFRGQVCSSVSECINTPGSYTCRCKQGFRKSEDDRSCVDVDECVETENICHQTCNNVWGTYRCSCRPGFTLGPDNKTCSDIDECKTYEKHGKLCVGICVNEPGSFSCSCPSGYRLSSDQRTCEDIDECLQPNVCTGDDVICLNTRGGYKCNRIACPPNYVRDRDHKTRCKRASQCSFDDPACQAEPVSISYNYITFVSRLPIPHTGQLDLFTMRGPKLPQITGQFRLDFKEARALGRATPPATREFFHLRRTSHNEAMVSLIRSIEGPQQVELELHLTMFQAGKFAGTAVAKIVVFVSEFEF